MTAIRRLERRESHLKDELHDYSALNQLSRDQQLLAAVDERIRLKYHPRNPLDVKAANEILREKVDSMNPVEKAAYVRMRVRSKVMYDGPGGP